MSSPPALPRKRRVGVVGYGSLGKYLVKAILTDAKVSARLELAFVWNRTFAKVAGDSSIPEKCKLENLDDFAASKPDLIVEVAHPLITKEYGARFLAVADYMPGSPTALADRACEASVLAAAAAAPGPGGTGLYLPSGALWGAQDIQKMSARGGIARLAICMKKDPAALKAVGSLLESRDALLGADGTWKAGETELFKGSVRDLCPLAPNNVNTMACCALAGSTLGFDRTEARLCVDPALKAHVVEIDVWGHPKPNGEVFHARTVRYSPAAVGAVTSSATYNSFVSSMMQSYGRGSGVHFS
jgi:predicted dinucleotide-utilizing enzyme